MRAFISQQFYPRLVVDVAVHAGTEKGTSGALRFRDRTICEGTLGEMVRGIQCGHCQEPEASLRGGWRLASTSSRFPRRSFERPFANALIHRDYNPRYDGQAVSVDIYDDRIEDS